MGIFDKAQQFAQQHPEQANQGIDKAGDLFDDKTGGKFAHGTDQAQDAAKTRLVGQAGAEPGEPGQPRPDQAPAQDPTTEDQPGA